MVMIALAGGIGIGAQSLIARSIGERTFLKADNAARVTLILGAAFGIACTVVGLLAIDGIIGMLGAPADVYGYSTDYLGIILLGAPAIFLSLGIDAILRGIGDTRRAMLIMSSAALANVVLDPLLIFGAGWGVQGAAVATVIARYCSLAIGAYCVLNPSATEIDVRAALETGRLALASPILSVGLPASLTQLSYSISLFVMNSILATYGGDALAVFGVGFRIESLAFLPMFGLSGAFISAAGYYWGAGRKGNVLTLRGYAYRILIPFMSCCALLFFVAPEAIYAIFVDDAAVQSMGVAYMRINVLVYPLVPLSIISSAVFQASGRGRPPFVLAFMRSWLVVLPLALYVSRVMDGPIELIWWSMVVGNLISAIVGHVWSSSWIGEQARDTNI
jgi:putative MATE family efflux protein